MSANKINFISLQFEKILTQVKANKILTDSLSFETLSVQSINVYSTNSQTTSGNFNTFIITDGIVTSAYNTVNSELTSLCAAIDTELSSFSAAVFNVFFDAGTARLDNYVRPNLIAGSITQIISGTKIVPTGLTIGAQDINLNIMYKSTLDNTILNDPISIYQITSAYPIAHLGDFDFELNDIAAGELDDYGNNYVAGNKIQFTMYIQNIPWNYDVILQWSVLKIY